MPANLIANPLPIDVKTKSFLAGFQELYTEIQSRDFRVNGNLETIFGRLDKYIQSGGTVGFSWHIDSDWTKAQTIKKQAEKIGYRCKIQKRYSIPAKAKNKVIWKKYKGLSWEKNGSPNYTNVYIEIALDKILVHNERT